MSQDVFTISSPEISAYPVVGVNGRSLFPRGVLTGESMKFPKGFNGIGKEIALQSFSCYYACPSVLNATTKFSYIWVDGLTYDVSLKTYGTYSASDMNLLLQYTMLVNGHYLYNATTSAYLYYLTIAANGVEYALQANSLPVPTSLPSGYALGTGAAPAWSLPGAARNPQFVFAATPGNDWCTLSGFSAGTFPASATPGVSYSVVGGTPHLSPTSSISIRCNLAYSTSSYPQDQVGTVPIDVEYGTVVKYLPNQLVFYPCAASTFDKLECTLRNDSEGVLPMLDYAWKATFIVRNIPQGR